MELGNTTTLSSIQLLSGFIFFICLFYNVALTFAGDFVYVQRKSDERDIMVRLSGLSAMETATGYGPDIEFIYRGVTDGARLVQAVYDDQYQMKNCLITNDEDKILDLLTKLREIHLSQLSKLSKEHHGNNHHHHGQITELTKSDFEFEEFKQKFQYAHNANDSLYFRYNGLVEDLPFPANTMLNIETMQAECEKHEQQMTSERHLDSEEERSHPRKLQQNSGDTLSRQKRGFWTWPGTLWCGKGTDAKSYGQLGEHTFADRCCREHDHCPDEWTILGRSKKYHLYNSYFFTISHCKCDKQFHQCLKNSQTTVANEIGHTFFNRIGMQCFVFKEKEQCVEPGWWGKCNRYEKVTTAVLRDGHTFPKSAKRKSREAEMSVDRALNEEQKIEQRVIKMAEKLERQHNKTMAKEARMLEKEEAALRKAAKLAESDERKLNKTLEKEARLLKKEQDRIMRKQVKQDERESRRLNKTLAKEARLREKEEAALRKQAKFAAREKQKLENPLGNEVGSLETEAAVLIQERHQIQDAIDNLEEEITKKDVVERIPILNGDENIEDNENIAVNDQNVEIIEVNINNAAQDVVDNSFEFEISGDSEFTRLNK